MDLLNDNPVCILKGDEFLPKEGTTFAQQVTSFFKSQGGMANSPFGIVVLDKKGVQNSKQHGNSRIKSASFAAVKDVLENGIVIMPLDYYGTNDKKEMTGMVAAPIQIGEENYVCVVEVIANLVQKRLYLHESFLIKNLQEVVASNLVHGSEASSPQPDGDVAKVLQNYLIAKQNEDNNNQNKEKANENMKSAQKISLNEALLRRIIRESVKKVLKEYNGYDSLKAAYGEQGYEKFGPHLERVARADGYERTDSERQKMDDRSVNNRKNLDKLRLRQQKNPYRDYLKNKEEISKLEKNNSERLKRSVSENVMSVLNEHLSDLQMNGHNISPKQALAQFLRISPKMIYGKDNSIIFETEEQRWYVFSSEMDAEEHARDVGPDFCEHATDDEYWYRAGYEKDNNGDFDWRQITNDILENKGAEWFFASYNGICEYFPDGYIGYRID